MTPQERDLLTALLERLKAQGGRPKDPEADQLIRRAVGEQPDAPYLLAQTVLIQDLSLNAAQSRIAELERQLAAAKSSAAAEPPSFLPARGSVPSTSPAASPIWSQSGGPGPAPGFAVAPAAPIAGSGFLRQAAATAAGIAGGALLFQGLESLLGPHYGSGFLAGVPTQPGISETVINNYYGDQNAPDESQAAADQDDLAGQDVSDVDLADQDMGDSFDDSDYDV